MASTFKGDGFKFTSARVKRTISMGGTGTPGSAQNLFAITKRVTGLTDTTATDIFTVTVPNAQHSATIEVDALAVLGAGGAVGAGEASRLSKYQVIVTRTAGLAAVIAVSSAIGGVASNVAGATSIASAVITASAVSGGNTATQTFTIKLAITKTGGSSDNHTAAVSARLLNYSASGVTIA
jgi:hypothetical protein